MRPPPCGPHETQSNPISRWFPLILQNHWQIDHAENKDSEILWRENWFPLDISLALFRDVFIVTQSAEPNTHTSPHLSRAVVVICYFYLSRS